MAGIGFVSQIDLARVRRAPPSAAFARTPRSGLRRWTFYIKTDIRAHETGYVSGRLPWYGASIPNGARREAGFQIERVQRGFDPDDWKPMKTVGSGVREIRIRDAVGAFRVIYIV